MNQNSKFAKPILARLVSVRIKACSRFAIAGLLCCIFTPANTFAQGERSFPTTSNSVKNIASWTPPDSSSGLPRTQSSNRPSFPNPSSNAGFPDAPVAFAPFQPSDSSDNSSDSPSQGAFESTINSTASMLSNLSDSLGEKTTGLFSGDNEDTGFIGQIQSLFGSSEIGKMLGSLALVLGLYFAFVWVMRKINPGGNHGLPPEVISVIGQVPFGPRRNLQLVRLGSKLLLLMNSPEGTQPIGEINDALEVEYLTSLCPGKNSSEGGFAKIHRAAQRLTETSRQPVAPSQTTPASTNLKQVIRMLEDAAKQGGTVFEA